MKIDKKIFDVISSYNLNNINNSIKIQHPITGISNGMNIQAFIDFTDEEKFEDIQVYEFDKLNSLIQNFDFNIEKHSNNLLLTKDEKKATYILSDEKSVQDDSNYDLYNTLNTLTPYLKLKVSKEDIGKIKVAAALFNKNININDTINIEDFNLKNNDLDSKNKIDVEIDFNEFLKIPAIDYDFLIFKDIDILLLKHDQISIILPLK
jgi:hypothetical protein